MSIIFVALPVMFTVPQPTATLPDDNMGVHLAQLTMSVLCYPMGATIGCGLQDADAFSLKKKHTYVQKHSLEFLQRVTQRQFLSAYIHPTVIVGRYREKIKENAGKYGRGAHPINNRLNPKEKLTFLIKGNAKKTERQNAHVRPNKGDL